MTEPGEILKDEARNEWEIAMRSAQNRAGRYYAVLKRVAGMACQLYAKRVADCLSASCFMARDTSSCGKHMAMLALEAEAVVQPLAHGGIAKDPRWTVGELHADEVIPKRAEENLPWCPVCKKRTSGGSYPFGTSCSQCGTYFDPLLSEQLVPKCPGCGKHMDPPEEYFTLQLQGQVCMACRAKGDEKKRCERCNREVGRLERVSTQDGTTLCVECFAATRYPDSGDR